MISTNKLSSQTPASIGKLYVINLREDDKKPSVNKSIRGETVSRETALIQAVNFRTKIGPQSNI